MRLRLGTRGSELALTQSEGIAARLRQLGHDVELVRITTRGDIERGSLKQVAGLGVFAAEVRAAVLNGDCDFAVHSLKDLPVEPVPGLALAAVPPRADHRDVLCSLGPGFLELPAGARIGTGSPRRVAQLRAIRSDLEYVDIRGNLGTRLARISDGDLAAVVLAAAGLKRLGRHEAITEALPILPAPGQGALGLECRAEAAEVRELLAAVGDSRVAAEVAAERAVLAGLGGGCAAPIAALAADGWLQAGVFAADGSRKVLSKKRLAPGAAEQAVAELLAQGAAQVCELGETRASRLAEFHDDNSLWGGSRSLAGARILVPRSEGNLSQALRAAGAEVVAEPLQRQVLLDPPALGEACWVVVTSAATVAALTELGIELPPAARVAAVGQATATALQQLGVTVDLMPTGRASAAALLEIWPQGGGRVVIPGSELSSPRLAEGLRELGYHVQTVPLYTMSPIESAPAPLAAEWAAGHFDAVLVTSGSLGRAVESLLGWRDDVAAVAFGDQTAGELRQAGVEVAAVAVTQDGPGAIEALHEALKGKQ